MAWIRISFGGASRPLKALAALAVVLAVGFVASPGTSSTGHAGSVCYALTISAGTGSGSVTNFPTSTGGCPSNSYSPSYPVTLLAEPAAGYDWVSWIGTDNDGTNPTTVTMIGNRKVTANFGSNCYTLTTNVGTGSGSVARTPSSAGGCPANQYPLNYPVTLLANAAPGYAFSSWIGTDNNGANLRGQQRIRKFPIRRRIIKNNLFMIEDACQIGGRPPQRGITKIEYFPLDYGTYLTKGI